MNDYTARLRAIIAEANAGAFFPDLSGVKLSDLEDPRIDQATVFGRESHRLKTYLAILLMRTMRDFTDTDSGVYKSHDAVDAIVSLGELDRDLRKRIRAQIRRAMYSDRWQYDSPIENTWTCIYCGSTVRNDGEGFSRRSHLETHKGSLPVERDDGFPFSGAHISVARGHLLGCLCGLVRTESWKNLESFFQKELDGSQFQALKAEMLSNGNALKFCREFDWDHDLAKGKPKRA